jgi:GNAT superfamily N-acetyltransferase
MEVHDFVSYVEDRHPVSLYMDRDGDKLILSSIVVPRDKRGLGIGKEVMQMIIDYADEVEMSVYLTPSTGLGASSLRRITNFYKQFGFVKKPRADFSRRESMVRYPDSN